MISVILLMSLLQLIASSEFIRFTVLRSSDVLWASIPLPFPHASTAMGLWQMAVPGVTVEQGQQLGALFSIQALCSKTSTSSSSAISTPGAPSRHHHQYSKGAGISPCELLTC